MIAVIIDVMVFLGSALMVYNIYGFTRFARYIKSKHTWESGDFILNVPIVLLVFFLAGYLVIGIFGAPDLIMALILFGGSVFVFVMYRMLSGIIRKLTENEHLEAELLAAEESNRAKNSFLASISHEMRTPMNVILGMDTLALKNPDIPEQTRDQLEKIGHSARHLSGLIDNILDIQEMSNEEPQIRREVFSLKETLDQINAVFSVICEEKGLTYETSLADCALRDYYDDGASLKRALMNLLDNAVKFTDAPGVVRFEVSCEKEDDVYKELHFIISDTGIGIDEEFLPKVFEPFTQADASFANRYGGSGTGLAAANSIVTRMGGRIEASSKKNEGSTFTVIIPVDPGYGQGEDGDEKRSTSAAPVQVQEENDNGKRSTSAALGQVQGDIKYDNDIESSHAGRSEMVSLKGCRILIVEDLPENAEIVADLLELEGAESAHASNGQEAVKMVKESGKNEYDAILMDLRMPGMDGLEAAGRIRALPRADAKSVPIIALTANAYESDVRNSLYAGMNGHLAKPVNADQLYAELKKWIREARKEADPKDM